MPASWANLHATSRWRSPSSACATRRAVLLAVCSQLSRTRHVSSSKPRLRRNQAEVAPHSRTRFRFNKKCTFHPEREVVARHLNADRTLATGLRDARGCGSHTLPVHILALPVYILGGCGIIRFTSSSCHIEGRVL